MAALRFATDIPDSLLKNLRRTENGVRLAHLDSIKTQRYSLSVEPALDV